jgi:restriction endonuclease S subunit
MSFSDWKEVALGDIVDELGDGLHGTPKYNDNGEYYFINGNNLDGNIVIDEKTKKVNYEQYLKYKKNLNDRTIFISINGTLGNVAVYNNEKVMLGKSVCYFNVKRCYNKEFIKYVMKSNYFKYYINNYSTGTTIKNMGLKQMRGFKFFLPEYNEQKAIAHILTSLDEKIEINNQINKTLENMAQAIFKQWFVDFKFPCIPEDYKFSNKGFENKIEELPNDFERVCTYKRVGNLPVPDGENWFVYVLLCKDVSFFEGITKDLYRTFYEHYKGIGAKHTKEHKPIKVLHYEKYSTQNEAIKREEELKTASGREWIEKEYDKFKADSNAHKSKLMMAGEMIESELGLIPKGWEVVALHDIADIIMGQSPKGSSYNESNNGAVFLSGKN